MLRETALFDTLHSELSIVLEETQDAEIDADQLATRLLDNDEDTWLLIGLTEGATAVLTKGDKEPEKRRTVSITVGTYSPDTYLRSGTTPPEWNNDVLFQERYRLAPDETVSPEFFRRSRDLSS